MSDGDIIHKNLRWYANVYKYICEGKASPQECIWELMKALLKDVRYRGDEPIKIFQLMAQEIENRDLSFENLRNFDDVNKKLEKVLKQSNLSHYNQEHCRKAIRQLLHQLKYKSFPINNIKEAITAAYLEQLLESNFKGRIPCGDEHYAGIDDLSFQQKLQKIIQPVKDEIPKFAQKANEKETFLKLRRPSKLNPKKQENSVQNNELNKSKNSSNSSLNTSDNSQDDDLLSDSNHFFNQAIQNREDTEDLQITTTHQLKQLQKSLRAI
ncbi:hypothetical protein [Crocosphaera sp.]|uniref:hypothetical protein n=1 Tax=Crocosphaera sp. TaxID=2729996 RepID=UPI0026201356|nr:hypothetical protein [Crocosphaera sp.]